MPPAVLIVEDDTDMRETVAEALRGAGYKVQVTGNGAQALAALEDARPSVVLLDLMMPIMGGWQLLEIMRSRPRLAKIPVIIITASDKVPGDSVRVLRKPFDLDALLRTVGDCCLA